MSIVKNAEFIKENADFGTVVPFSVKNIIHPAKWNASFC